MTGSVTGRGPGRAAGRGAPRPPRPPRPPRAAAARAQLRDPPGLAGGEGLAGRAGGGARRRAERRGGGPPPAGQAEGGPGEGAPGTPGTAQGFCGGEAAFPPPPSAGDLEVPLRGPAPSTPTPAGRAEGAKHPGFSFGNLAEGEGEVPLRGPAASTPTPSGFRGPELSTLADDLEDASPAPSARLPLLVSQSTLGGASGLILALAAELSGAHGTPLWEPLGLGVLVGGIYATVVDICVVTRWLVPGRRLGVVVTGGSRGLGKAMAREFLLNGDRVVLTSRSQAAADRVARELRADVGPGCPGEVVGLACDITDPRAVEGLAAFAAEKLGAVDIWVNNAGYSGKARAISDCTSEQVAGVVGTNLLGTVLCTQNAIRCIAEQGSAGQIFNVDGAGADGIATPFYSVYGATKAAVSQFTKSIIKEGGCGNVGLHTVSPGMVLTDLLLEGASRRNKAFFNILCEQPETVAAYLVPRMRSVWAWSRRWGSYWNRNGTYIKYLTPLTAVWRFLRWPLLQGRFFDADGRAVYRPEEERVKNLDRNRRALKERKRGTKVAYAYGISLVAVHLAIVLHPLEVAQALDAFGATVF